MSAVIPIYWKDFVEQHALSGAEIDIPSGIDPTGAGAEFEILSDVSIRQEAEELFPGIGVAADGFVPVGGCVIGTGDPYFINSNDGPCGPLYRIYHDAVSDAGYDRNDAVDLILNDYSELLKFKVVE